jgi:hypothetical protein
VKIMHRKLKNWANWKLKLLWLKRNPFIFDKPMKYSLRRLLLLQRWARKLYFKRRVKPMLRVRAEYIKKRSMIPAVYEKLQQRYLPQA